MSDHIDNDLLNVGFIRDDSMNDGFIEGDSDSDETIEIDSPEFPPPPRIIKSQRRRPNFQIWDSASEELKTYQVNRIAIAADGSVKLYIKCFQTRNRQHSCRTRGALYVKPQWFIMYCLN